MSLRTKLHTISSGQQLLGDEYNGRTNECQGHVSIVELPTLYFLWSKQCHVEFHYDKSSTLWALWLWCWKGKRSHLLAVWNQLAGTEMINAKGTWVWHWHYLQTSWISFFIYKLDPMMKISKIFYGNLLLKDCRDISYNQFADRSYKNK